jgi:hypothetical protein
MTMIKRTILAAIVILAMAPVADAGLVTYSVGPTCDSCQGGVYSLTFDPAAAIGSPFNLVMTFDTTGYIGGGAAIDAVAFKISNAYAASVVLTSAPGGIGSWSFRNGGISANGCNGNGGGFECEYWIGANHGTAVGGVLNWSFNVTLPSNAALDTPTIKGRYVGTTGAKVGDLVSEELTQRQVPDPGSTLLLFGIGLAGLTAFRSRRG